MTGTALRSLTSAATARRRASTTNGTAAQAWVIGKGLYDPTDVASSSNKYLGRTQDVGILIADVPLR